MSGVKNVGSAMVHTGFQFAYAVTQSTVLNTVKAQLASNPSYRVVVTGHSLGAAVAALAAVSIKSTFPNVNLQLYTYGTCALIIIIREALLIVCISRPAPNWKCSFCVLRRKFDWNRQYIQSGSYLRFLVSSQKFRVGADDCTLL